MQTKLRPNAAEVPMRGAASEAGFSLVEGLMAAALLLVVAISVLPMFMRALESNIRGGRASQAAALVTGELEAINQATVDREEWQLTGADTGVRELAPRYWDLGVEASGDDATKIGDERWIEEADTPAGQVLWWQQLQVRKYSYADVHSGIMVGEAALATLGDPRWFDSPLTTDTTGGISNAHITEFRLLLREDRDGKPAKFTDEATDTTTWMSQRMTVGHFRTY